MSVLDVCVCARMCVFVCLSICVSVYLYDYVCVHVSVCVCVIIIFIRRTDPIAEQTYQSKQLQTQKTTVYLQLHKTTHLDRQSHVL